VKKRKGLWRIWAKALGPKEGRNEKEADIIACVRTIVLISYMITNCFIIAGVVRHWQKEKPAEAGCILQATQGR
jgi:hypothetical protein